MYKPRKKATPDLASRGRAAGATAAPLRPIRMILGVDPGSRVTGYAFLRARRPRPLLPADFEIVEAGVLRADPRLPHGERLGLMHEALFELMNRQHLRPDVCVLEKAFFDKNVNSALKLGEMRGAYIAACARHDVPVEEITPAEVKRLIAGNGRAEKEMVSLALRSLTGFDRGALPHDVTDAVAISLSFGMRMTTAMPAPMALGTKRSEAPQ